MAAISDNVMRLGRNDDARMTRCSARPVRAGPARRRPLSRAAADPVVEKAHRNFLAPQSEIADGRLGSTFFRPLPPARGLAARATALLDAVEADSTRQHSGAQSQSTGNIATTRAPLSQHPAGGGPRRRRLRPIRPDAAIPPAINRAPPSHTHQPEDSCPSVVGGRDSTASDASSAPAGSTDPAPSLRPPSPVGV